MNNVLNEANTSHRSWNNLSMQEKAAMIKVAVKNGLTDLKTIREKYNEFAEGGDIYPSEEMNEFGGGGYIYDVLPGMLKKAGLDIRVSSGYRPAGKVGTSGKRSWHWRHGAVDIVPQGRTTFEDIERVVSTNPEIIQYMTANGFGYLDETNRTPEGRALMKKTGATGNHFHFGKDTRARERYQAILGRGNAATLPVTATSEVIAPTAEQPIVPFFMPSNPQVFFSNPVTTSQPVVDMEPTRTPMLEYDPKEAERQEKRDNLNRFNMFLGMLNGSNESTFPFSMFAEGGKIHISPSKKGTFTAAASRHNMGVQEFASKVLANKDDYSSAMVRKANFARNASRWKHGLGGNLFEDGGPKKPLTRDDLRRMLLNRRAEAEAAYNGSVTETRITPNDNAWVDKPLTRRKKNPHSSRRAEEGAKAHAAWEREHPNLAAWGNLAGAVPFAVAAAPLGAGIVAGGDALAATTAGQAITSGLAPLYQAATGATIAGAPALTWADAGLTSAFGAHGISQVVEDGGISPMAALEIAPLGMLAKPMWNIGKETAYNIADRYIFMPHQNSFTRGIGMTDAGLQDAVATGVFRGNPRGTEQTAKMFDKMFLNNRNHFRDIVEDTGIPGIESRYQSRTLTKEDFNALKKASEKYRSLESRDSAGKITLKQSIDPLENYATYEDYRKAVASDIAKTEQMPGRIASGEIAPNTELSEPMWFEDESGKMLLPQGKPFLERFGPNSDYLADGTPLSYWYADGRNPITQGHAYAKSNYGVRVNNPEDYQPFMHELHLHPSFFRSPKFSDPNVEIFGKGPLGLTVKLDKKTLQPLWKRDLSNIFRKVESTTPQITAENAARITPAQWTAAQDAAIARGDMAEAQRLRDLHFKVSAPNTKVVDGTGNPQLVIHKTPNDFTVFDNSRSIGNLNWAATPKAFEGENGVFATGAGTSPKEMRLYVNMKNPHYPTIDEGMEPAFINEGEDGILGIVDKDMTDFYRSASDAGEGFNMSLGVDNPYALKSAVAVTYDDNGIRIPLGSRDNFNMNDIRYGLLPFGIGLTGYGLLPGK